MARGNTTPEIVEITAIDRATNVLRNIKGELATLRSGLDTFKGALAAVGLTVGVGAMIKFAKDTLNATAALDDMAESTGISVENLSKLQAVARIGGHDFSTLTDQVSKMIKGLKEGGEEGNKSTRAFAFMGVKVKEANGQFRDAGLILQDTARALGNYADDGNKVALVQDALGKGAQKYLPYLKDIAEYGDRAATVTTKQAEEAEKLQKEINKLGLAFDEASRSLLIEWLPALTKMVQLLGDATKAAKDSALGGIFGGIGLVLGTDTSSLASINKQLAEAQENIRKLEAPKSIGEKYRNALNPFADIQLAGYKAQEAYLKSARDRMFIATVGDDYGPGERPGGPKASSGYKPQSDADIARAKKEAEAIRALRAELAGVDKDFTEDLMRLHGEYKRGAMTLDEYRASVEKLIAKQKFAQDIEKQREEIAKAEIARATTLGQANEQYANTRDELTRSGVERERQLREEIKLVGLTAEAVEMANAMRQIELELQHAISSLTEQDEGLRARQIEQLMADAEARKQRVAALIEERQALEARNRASDERIQEALNRRREVEAGGRVVEQAIANGIMLGFRNAGPDFGRRLVTIIQDAMITAFLTPIANRIAQPFGQWAAESMGGSSSSGGFGGMFPSFGADAWRTPPIIDQETGAMIGGNFNWAGAAGVGLMGLGALQGYRGADKTANPAGAKTTSSLSMLGMAAGAPWGPMGMMVGGAAGSILGSFFGNDDGPTGRTAQIGGAFGSAQMLGNQWFGRGTEGVVPWLETLAAQEKLLIDRLGLTAEQMERINAAVSGSQTFGFGQEWTPWEQSGAAEKITAERLKAVSEVTGQSIEELTRIMSLSAEQWAKAIEQMEDALATTERNLRDFANNLPEVLGINQLEAYQKSLAVSPTLSPMDQLAAARTQYDDTLERALSGDRDAIFGFSDVAQQLLGIGREVYASGAGYQDLFREVNSSLNVVLEQQRSEQAELMTGLQLSLEELRVSWIDELKATKNALVQAMNDVKTQLERMQADGTG